MSETQDQRQYALPHDSSESIKPTRLASNFNESAASGGQYTQNVTSLLESQQPKSKNSFIYTKKEPATAQKPMARKLRPSQTANMHLQRSFNNTADPGVHTGLSQNDAETIATADEKGPSSPKNISQHYRQDSEVIAQSEPGQGKFFQVRNSRHGRKTGVQTGYYEDCIDSETEVFYDPDPNLYKTAPLFSDGQSEQEYNVKADLAGKLANHYKEIDLVLNSNFDEKTKQRMIQEIQQKYRQINLQASKQNKKPLAQNLRSRTQKKYKMPDLESDDIYYEKNNKIPSLTQQDVMNRKRKGGYQSLGMQSQIKSAAQPDRRKQQSMPKRDTKGKSAMKQQQRLRVQGQELNDQNRNYLMPEVNQFVDHEPFTKHYQTQDESFTAQKPSGRASRPVKKDKKKRSGSRSPNPTIPKTPDVLKERSVSCTRCDSCFQKQLQDCTHLKKRQDSKRTDSQSPRSPRGSQERAKKRQKPRKAELSIDKVDGSTSDAMSRNDYDSVGQQARKRKAHFTPGKIRISRQQEPLQGNNYMSPSNQNTDRTDGLPEVRIKKQKRSSSPNNPTSSQLRHRAKHQNRGALSQSINFGQNGLAEPVKQTNFYDNVHGSNVTNVKLDQWKAEPAAFIWSGKGNSGPKNRHRIPDPAPLHGPSPIRGVSQKQGSLSPSNTKNSVLNHKNYQWDLDGRRHARPKGTREVIEPTPSTQLPVLTPNKQGIPASQKNIETKKPRKSSVEDKLQKNRSIPSNVGKPTDKRLDQLRNDSSIIYVNVQSKNDLPSDGSKKKPDEQTEIAVTEHIYEEPLDNYQQQLNSNRQKAEEKLGQRLIVEDDFIKPGDFRDKNIRKALEKKAKKNVERAEKKKEGKKPGDRKPSIASSQKNKSPKRNSPQRSNDRSAGKRKKSDVSSPGRNTPLNQDPARPISQELDRESQISDPYKIMEGQPQTSDGSKLVPRNEVSPFKPMTAQTHPQPAMNQPVENVEGLIKSQEYIAPLGDSNQRPQEKITQDPPEINMRGSRPDQGDSADQPDPAVSSIPSQPPYLKGQADKPDTADPQMTEPPPENADISERPMHCPPSIFDDIASQEQPANPSAYYQRPMSITSTQKAKENAGISKDSPKSSIKKRDRSGGNTSNLRSSKDSKAKLPPFKVNTAMTRSNPSQAGLAQVKSPGIASEGRQSPRTGNAGIVSPLSNNAKPLKGDPRSPPKPRSNNTKVSPRASYATKKSPRYKVSDNGMPSQNSKPSGGKANSKVSKPSVPNIDSPIDIKDDVTEGANNKSVLFNQDEMEKRPHVQSQDNIPVSGRQDAPDYGQQLDQVRKPDDLKSSEGHLNNQLAMMASGTHFGSQVRFVDGGLPSENAYNMSQVEPNRRMNKNIASDNAGEADNKQSHYTKLVPGDGDQYSINKSVSYPTGYTKFQHKANLPLKIVKQPSNHSTTYDFPAKIVNGSNNGQADRAQTTQQPGKRARSKPSTTNLNSATNKSKSGLKSVGRQSSQRPMRFNAKQDIYVPGSNENKSQGRYSVSNNQQRNKLNSMRSGQSVGLESSKSPIRKLMEDITHQKAHIQEDTVILINATEKLTSKGISGDIHSVGVGFGTGRHTAGERNKLKTEVVRRQQKSSQSKRTVQQQTKLPDLHTTGCDAAMISVKSEILSAKQVSQANVGLSPRTQTQGPDQESVGLTAKELTVLSQKEEGDQVTEGRFDAPRQDMQAQTNKELLEAYLYKAKAEMATETTPIVIDDRKVTYATACIQTDVIVDERDAPSEPSPLDVPILQEKTARFNATQTEDYDDVASLLDEPKNETVYPMFEAPPPQEPEETDDGFVEDWNDSAIYKFVRDIHYDKLVKRGLIDQTKEERPSTASSQKGMTYQQRYDYNLNPDRLNILTYLEVDYGQSAMRHKSANYCSQETQQDLFDRAKTTIEVLTMNMVKPDICNHILFTHYKDVTKKNCIKLLLRCKRLYDARNEVVNILKMVTEVEAVLEPKQAIWRILQDDSSDVLKTGHHGVVMRTLKILANGLTKIAIFEQEHKLFKNEFRFNKEDYRDYLTNIGAIIGGFLLMKNQLNPSLQTNGSLLDKHEENDFQKASYRDWVDKSIEEFGRLDLPPEELDMILPEAQKKKLTRVEIALQKLEEEKKIEEQKKRERKVTSNAIKIISSNQSVGESQSESEKVGGGPSDQMLDRQKENELRKHKLLLQQQQQEEQAEKRPAAPQKQFGLELLKQQLKYDDEMEDQKTDSHKVSSIEMKEPSARHGSQMGYDHNNLLDSIDYHNSSVEMTHKNYQEYQSYDRQSQKSEISPIKRDGQVTMIDGLRVGMRARSPNGSRQSPQKANAEKEPLTTKNNKAKQNASHKYLDLNDSLDYGSEMQVRQALATPSMRNAAPSESTVQHGQHVLPMSPRSQTQRISASALSEFTIQQELSQKIEIEESEHELSIIQQNEEPEEAYSPCKIGEKRRPLMSAGGISPILKPTPTNQRNYDAYQNMTASVADSREETVTLFGQQSGKEVESPVKPYGKPTKVRFNDSQSEGEQEQN